MKSFTDLGQSKELAEFLPPESADMYYGNGDPDKISVGKWNDDEHDEDDIPCWSLAALFDILPNSTDIVKDKADTENEKYMCTVGVKYDIISTFGNNPVDACYEAILKLNKLGLI